ncbi:acyl transferase/acyl hydrolase/lysophospholipase [Xylariales sp. PMI_506]|nr:acyl transferase/acyl hydrolase/lysophospholipase [Xylariales sp. PMI_506]
MVILTTIRRSPAYLYLKTYCLCALVTLFQATPVSTNLPQFENKIKKYGNLPTSPGAELGASSVGGSHAQHLVQTLDRVAASRAKSSQCDCVSATKLRAGAVANRWWLRVRDLAQVKTALSRDDHDLRAYPELRWDATVRRSSALHPDEQRFIQLRRTKIASKEDGSLQKFLGLPADEKIDPQDVPLVALGGSGGGYRAMYGFAGFISAAKALGLWDCLTWVAGVSGSCWTIAGYYTIASQSVAKLIRHYLSVAKELAHPMSIKGLNRVARSSKGVYFLIGPLMRKAQTGIIGLGIMDLYSTLTTTYQLLSREPGASLSRGTFQFSKIWTRSRINHGAEPMPILTAVRRAPKDSVVGVKPHTDSSLSKGRPPSLALKQHQTAACQKLPERLRGAAHLDSLDSSIPKGFFQWFEISPLEVGCVDTESYVPTWSWGRSFVSGRSVGRQPEQSLSLVLGQCTSAPAGPLTGYISALLASMPKGTVMTRMLLQLNNFLRMQRWAQMWGNPIRAGHDPNPFYGLNSKESPLTASDKHSGTQLHHEHTLVQLPRTISNWLKFRSNSEDTLPQLPAPSGDAVWEPHSRIRLMDSGMSNNLPNHVLARPERNADVLIAFDASSDVHTGSAMRRIGYFAEDFDIHLEDHTGLFTPPLPRYAVESNDTSSTQADVESRFMHHYTHVYFGRRANGHELYIIYCPLLPNSINPEFNPSTAAFSTSYNLVWTPEQINTLITTSGANLEHYGIDVIKQVMKKVYLSKKERRLRPMSP